MQALGVRVAAPAPQAQSRSWVYTISAEQATAVARSKGFSLEEFLEPDVFPEFPSEQKHVWQLEQGDSGYRHVQGTVQLSRNQRLSAMKRIWPTAHFEVRRGTWAEVR